MKNFVHKTPDATILALIKDDNIKGWELLYDKYAPVMFGIICKNISDVNTAEEILIKLFTNLKNKKQLQHNGIVLSIYMLRYTYSNTKKEIQKRGIKYVETINYKNPILQLLCTQCSCVKEVAEILNLSEAEVKKNLRYEILVLRSKNTIVRIQQFQKINLYN